MMDSSIYPTTDVRHLAYSFLLCFLPFLEELHFFSCFPLSPSYLPSSPSSSRSPFPLFPPPHHSASHLIPFLSKPPPPYPHFFFSLHFLHLFAFLPPFYIPPLTTPSPLLPTIPFHSCLSPSPPLPPSPSILLPPTFSHLLLCTLTFSSPYSLFFTLSLFFPPPSLSRYTLLPLVWILSPTLFISCISFPSLLSPTSLFHLFSHSPSFSTFFLLHSPLYSLASPSLPFFYTSLTPTLSLHPSHCHSNNSLTLSTPAFVTYPHPHPIC